MPVWAQSLRGLAISLVLALAAPPALAENGHGTGDIAVRHITLVDSTRKLKAENGFAGSDSRRIDVTVWMPAQAGAGPYPLVIYSHGAYGEAQNGRYLAERLVRAGYIVAAPDYPLSSRAAYTKVTAADARDVSSQTKDVHFILDQLIADKALSPLIDAGRIATIGHSLGAVTSYFTSFGTGALDPRIKATVLMGAGDPVQAALAVDMGMTGTWNAPVSVPVLFLSGDHDAIARITGRAYAAYSRLNPPKYEVMIKGGVHLWFSDGAPEPADGSNPDCAMFGASRAGMPGCETDAKLIGRAREQEIAGTAVVDFLDGYLKGDKPRLQHLRDLPKSNPDVSERFEE